MSKANKSKNVLTKPASFSPLQPLECRHHGGRSEIVIQTDVYKAWEIIAETHPVAGISAETLAIYICRLINENIRHEDILYDAMDALMLCLTEGSLTFASEQAADNVVTRIKKVII